MVKCWVALTAENKSSDTLAKCTKMSHLVHDTTSARRSEHVLTLECIICKQTKFIKDWITRSHTLSTKPFCCHIYLGSANDIWLT